MRSIWALPLPLAVLVPRMQSVMRPCREIAPIIIYFTYGLHTSGIFVCLLSTVREYFAFSVSMPSAAYLSMLRYAVMFALAATKLMR